MVFLRFAVVGLALVLSFAPMAQAASSVTIDPDGVGGTGSITVGTLDWTPGNALIQNIESATSQAYAQSNLANFLDTASNPIPGTGLNSTFEWTYVLGVNNSTFQVLPLTILTPIAGGDNFFQIYYDPAVNSSPLAGTGFDDGTLILSGHFSTNGFQNFVAGANALHTDLNLDGIDDNTGEPIPLDESANGNQYPAISSVVGSGGGSLQIIVDFFDPAFFLTPPTVISLTYDTLNTLNFTGTDPSALFTTSGGTTPGATVGSIGTCNGCVNETAPNVMLQVDAFSAFEVQQVPFPGTLMLIGTGLSLMAGLAAIRRRKA